MTKNHDRNITYRHFILTDRIVVKHQQSQPAEEFGEFCLKMIMSDNFVDPSSASHPDSVLRLSSAVHRFAIVSLLGVDSIA